MPVKPLPVARPAGSGAIASDALSHMNDWSIPTTPQEKHDWAWEHPIYIFNVSDQRYIRHMGGLGPYTILGCEPGERYSQPTKVPRIVQEPVPVDIRKMEIRENSGLEVVLNVIGIAAHQPRAQGLDKVGVFWSLQNPPLEEEIIAAENMRAENDHEMVRQADEFHNAGPIMHVNITSQHRASLTRTNQKRPWGVDSINMEICPGCQSSINPGVVVHTCGAVLNWDKAIELGIKKASDRPEVPESKKRA